MSDHPDQTYNDETEQWENLSHLSAGVCTDCSCTECYLPLTDIVGVGPFEVLKLVIELGREGIGRCICPDCDPVACGMHDE